jgi:hypothetical protein
MLGEEARMEDEIPSRRPTKQPPREDTVRPPYDPEQYARESESRLRIAHIATHVPVASPMDESGAPPSSQSAARLTAAGEAADIPSPDEVPYRVMAAEELEWFTLDGDARAALELVNGLRSIGRIADTLGIAPSVAGAIFARLVVDDIIGFR